MAPFVHKIGKTRQGSSANHNRLAIIVYNISYSALSSPMNTLSTVGSFWVNKASRSVAFGLMKLAELDSLVV